MFRIIHEYHAIHEKMKKFHFFPQLFDFHRSRRVR